MQIAGRCAHWQVASCAVGGGAARVGAIIIIIIIIIISVVRQANYCEGSRAVPAHPSGKDRLKTREGKTVR